MDNPSAQKSHSAEDASCLLQVSGTNGVVARLEFSSVEYRPLHFRLENYVIDQHPLFCILFLSVLHRSRVTSL
jgi:hypothetical protein